MNYKAIFKNGKKNLKGNYGKNNDFSQLKQILQIGSIPFLVQIVTFNYSAIMPLLQNEWGMNAAQAGAVFSAQQGGFVLAAVVLTALTDFVPAWQIYFISSLGVGIANIAFALFANSFTQALWLRGIVGFCLGGTYMPGLRAVSEGKQADQRGRVVGLFVGALVLGGAASQSLPGLLLSRMGWRLIFVIASLAVFVGSYLAWRLMPRYPLITQKKSVSYDMGMIKSVFSNAPLIIIIAIYGAHMWELYGVRGWLVTYLSEVLESPGRSEMQTVSIAANWSGFIIAAGAFLVWLGGGFSDRLGRTRTILIFMAGGSLFSFTFGWIMNLPVSLVILTGVVYGFLVIGDSAVISTTVIDLAPVPVRGTAMAVQTLLGFSIAATSPVVFGIVLDAFSRKIIFNTKLAWGMAFSMLGFVSLIGVMLVLLLRYVKKRQGIDN